MHRILVEEKRWIGEERFLHALNYCMLLPGPEAQQLATYIGWLLHKTKGGLVAGTLFVLPGLLAKMALSGINVLVGDLPLAKLSSSGSRQRLLGGFQPLAAQCATSASICRWQNILWCRSLFCSVAYQKRCGFR